MMLTGTRAVRLDRVRYRPEGVFHPDLFDRDRNIPPRARRPDWRRFQKTKGLGESAPLLGEDPQEARFGGGAPTPEHRYVRTDACIITYSTSLVYDAIWTGPESFIRARSGSSWSP